MKPTLFIVELFFKDGRSPLKVELYGANKTKVLLSAIELFPEASRLICNPVMQWS